MTTNFIYSTNYHDALSRVIELINSRKVDLDVRHLLIVPERYTLLAEKELYKTSLGSFDVEVLSLSRLFYRMKIDTPLLSREGAIMLIRGMLRLVTLECFNKSASHRGFCEKLYDAINDFAASGVSPSDIPPTTSKLSDLRKIYELYLSKIDGRFVDSMGKLALIAKEAATSEYLNNVHIYVANFDYVDKATSDVFDALKNRALSFTESRVNLEKTVRFRAEKYYGEGAMAIKEVAKRMRRLAYEGVDLSEMAVIVGNADYARIRRIFTEFDLRCFVAQDKRLSEYPLYVFVSRLLGAARNLRRDNVIELSKNLFTGLDRRECEEFENYVLSNLIDYGGFKKQFDAPVERTRKRIMDMVAFAGTRIASVNSSGDFYKLISDIFDEFNVVKICDEKFGSDAQASKILSLISLMDEVEISGNFDFVFSVFEEGAKATKVSELPYNGGIIVGDPASLRGGKYKFTAVIGFDDGFLPQIYDDSSLIGDDEKALFDRMERVDMINARYEDELFAVLNSSDYVFATYMQPSGMMNALLKDADKVGERTGDILLDAGGAKHAVELLMQLKRIVRDSPDRDDEWESDREAISALTAATGTSGNFFTSRKESIEDGESLFFPSGTTSVSQLQSYFGCPFLHFLNYGLKLKKRDTGELLPLDVGNFLHAVVEKVVSGGDFSDIASAVKKATDELKIEGKYALEANAKAVEELIDIAIPAISIYASHLLKGSFTPLGQEIEFSTALKGIKLVGKIDMADEYDGFIRLIDYKTGRAAFKPSDVFYGTKIQLPLYMAAAIKKGYRPAAMFNYPLGFKWLDGKLSHRFEGFMLKDGIIAKAVDRDFEKGGSEVFNMSLTKKGALTGGRNSLVSFDEMYGMIDYAVRLCENAVKEIKDGYIAASPTEKACEKCDFNCLCESRRLRAENNVGLKTFSGEIK